MRGLCVCVVCKGRGGGVCVCVCAVRFFFYLMNRMCVSVYVCVTAPGLVSVFSILSSETRTVILHYSFSLWLNFCI